MRPSGAYNLIWMSFAFAWVGKVNAMRLQPLDALVSGTV
jgi:hypothetical protein